MRDELNDVVGQDRATRHDAVRVKVLQVADKVIHLVQNPY